MARTYLSLFAALLFVGIARPTQAQEPNVDEIIDAYNEAGLKLFAKLKEGQQNLVISPSSLGTVLSMARTGARGKTQEEMTQALAHTLAADKVDASQQELLKELARTGGDSTLTLANGLCLTAVADFIGPKFKKNMQENYGAAVFSGTDVGPINAWVKDKTQGRIDKILDKLNPNSICVLLNTVYFSSPWLNKFEAQFTKPGEFNIAPDRKVTVPMMVKNGKMPLVAKEQYKAVAIPYKDKSLALVLILPNPKGSLEQVEKLLSAAEIRALVSGFQKEIAKLNIRNPMEEENVVSRVTLLVPKFKIETDADVIPALQKSGMERAFDGRAEFAGLIDDAKIRAGDIFISQIKHRAQIEIDETGTVASAASAAEASVRSASSQLAFNQPFSFLLVDVNNGAVHFMGRVVDPSVAEKGK